MASKSGHKLPQVRNILKATFLSLVVPLLIVAACTEANPIQSSALQTKEIDQSDYRILMPVMVNYGTGQISGDDWPMVAANSHRTSWTTEEVRGDLAVEWYRPIEPYIPYKVQPIATNGKIYVSTARGLYAFNAQDGAVSWIYPTELPLGHSPTIAEINGRTIAFVGGYDRKIHALDANTGQPIVGFSSYIAGAGFETNPLIINDMIYAGNRDGNFYALDARTGEFIWKYQTNDAIYYSAAYKDGAIYFASNDAHAYALNANDGSLIWKSNKLPGSGFHSFWPVVYTNPSTGSNYVIFSSGENIRKVYMNLVIEESDTLFGGIPDSALIGPTSTSVPGDWVAGTVTIDARILTEYLEKRPDRRTVFVLDSVTGKEYTYDSDKDGKAEYAPFIQSGVTHSGSKYPPVVNGVDGVYYQANAYIAPGWITRGGPVGWKFGTKYISRVDGKDVGFASDEPLAYSTGGSLIYWSLCCDREAGSMDVTIPYGQPNRAWGYYGYNLANNVLTPGYQQMYNAGDAEDYNEENGWQHYSGKAQSKNGVYGKHGSSQSPPIPYMGKLYMLRGNALIAFSPTGTNPKSPLPLAATVPASGNSTTWSRAEISQKLEIEVQKIIDAGPLRPGYHDAGFIDHYGNGWYTDENEFGEIFDYFQNPSDTVYTLLLAYPRLSPSTQGQIRTYLTNNYGPGADYDITRIVHVGWGTGAPREQLIIPTEVAGRWGDPYTSPYYPSTTPTCGICGYWQNFPPFSFYAAWQYAKIVGNNDSSFARNVFDRMKTKLEAPLSDYIFSRRPYWLNQYIAGYLGYLELQQLAGYPQDSNVLAVYQDLLELRVNTFSKDTPYLPLGSDGSDPSYNNSLAVARNFMFLTPELASYLNQQIASKVETAIDEYEYVAPYWFVAMFDNSYGEGTLHHFYDYPAIFQAKAYILEQPFSELAKWLDAPAFYRGDLFYIQNLTAALEAN